MTVCATHGGQSPNARLGAARRLAVQAAEADARRLLAHEGHRGVTDPVEVISRVADEADAMRAALGARVNALHSVRFEDAKGAEQLRSEVALYERALDRTVRFCEVLARLGTEERLTRVTERQVDQLDGVLRGVLDALDLSEEQRALLPVVVPREVRALRVVGDSNGEGTA